VEQTYIEYADLWNIDKFSDVFSCLLRSKRVKRLSAIRDDLKKLNQIDICHIKTTLSVLGQQVQCCFMVWRIGIHRIDQNIRIKQWLISRYHG